MELLCGVGKPQRRSGWESAWGRASAGKGGLSKEDPWGIKRSATMPLSGTGLARGGTLRGSSPQAHRRHLLPSTLPSATAARRADRDPYREPLCPSDTSRGTAEDVVLVDDIGEPGVLRRSQTLPMGAFRKTPMCLSGATAPFQGGMQRRGSVSREAPSQKSAGPPRKDETTAAATREEQGADSESARIGGDEQPVARAPEGEDEDALSFESPFRRTFTLPPRAMCRGCPTQRTSERRKVSYVHSKTEPDKENVNSTNVVLASDAPFGTKAVPAWRGKRNSTSSTGSGLSRFTSTTTTDEGVCLYSEGGSVTSSSAYGSVRGGTWSASSMDEGVSVYSAPSVASSADLSSASSLYERAGARPKLRLGPTARGIFHKKGSEDDDEKCHRCQREAAGAAPTLRRARSLRSPRHLPVTPTLLRLLQLVRSETEGLEQVGGNVGVAAVQRREKPHPPRIDAHRFSRANLEDSGDVELDAILGELCALETQFEFEITAKNSSSASNLNTTTPRTTSGTDKMQPKQQQQQQQPQPQLHPHQQSQQRHSHSRSNSGNTRQKFEPLNVDVDVTTNTMGRCQARTDSPDNDSAFSDNVSMLSSESSASSGASGSAGSRHDAGKHTSQTLFLTLPQLADLLKDCGLNEVEQAAKLKAEKIKMALEKIKEANVKKLFIKAFTSDGSTKSLLVDEKMTVAFVTRLLADKNHVRMDPKWAVVEHIPDLYMERIYEDDEMLVENLLLWTRDSKNKLLFLERPDKYDLFLRPEQYILIGSSSQKHCDLDDDGRNTLIEEFFSSTGVGVPEVEGPLFLKSEGKKVWKKYYFVLRASGLYYCPKGKSSRSSKDLVCLTTLEVNQVYYGVGWKKKYKAPSDWCFAIKHPHLQAKSSKYIKYLSAEDPRTLAQWVMGIRIAKSGKRLLDNYRSLVEDIAQEDIDMLASSRSFSIASMAGQSGVGGSSQGPSQATTPSSESQSLDSCLAPSLTPSVVDGDEGGEDAHSSTGSSSQDTPVNTLGRPPVWRQDSLKSGSSSSSSGCLSERSSAGTPTGEHGFESEFPQGTIKRKPSSNPKLPLTTTTRLLVKEVDGEDVVDTASNRGTASRQSLRRSLTEEVNTLRRRNSATQSRSSVNSSSSSSILNTSMGSPVPQEEEMDSLPLPPPPPELSEPLAMELLPPPPPELLASTLSLNSLPPPPDEASLPPINPEDLMMASITSLPPPPPPSPPKPSSPPSASAAPPPPPHAVLPPPSQEPGAPPPPPHGLPLPPPTTPKPNKSRGPGSPVYQATGSPVYQSAGSPVYQAVTPPAVAPKPRRDSSESATYASPPYLAELRAHSAHVPPNTNAPTHKNGWHPESPLPPPPPSPPPHQPVYAQPQRSPQKKVKRITFVDDVQDIPPAPESPTTKPPLPRRSESTRLSNPGRLDSPGNKVTPPRSFLTSLQRVMQKKWQVAQKCKDFDKMPHEVLGFRDPVLPSETERNVGAWIQEHYGSLYENLSPHGSPPQPSADSVDMPRPIASHTLQPSPPPHADDLNRLSQTMPGRKKPPPPPPKRSDSTHLSTRQ
ncbi:ras-associated and pleckstrin homology domains-containing protein 1-like isoform X4 [Penaeus japonicus]|uniref:ras-associated and pleckstrin homology domains-containing protein 1-like isoform X4 n=1 Tax=Penaeus japonicus TaxID=27405 RepID=UPI001C713178|nr:ras-associated and pleckstrin homology domains-containing protein 1-like isoform X4 [Penaeus japonicus]